jgi:hypothetical protein
MLDQTELTALKTFAVTHGRRWKSQLQVRWEHANCSPELMRVRNKIGPSGLAAIRQLDLDNAKLPPTPREEFEKRTAIMPDVVAETVLGRMDHELTPAQCEWFVKHTDVWTRWFHANDSQWKRSLERNDNRGRDRLYSFVEHWAYAFRKDPALYQKRHPLETIGG